MTVAARVQHHPEDCNLGVELTISGSSLALQPKLAPIVCNAHNCAATFPLGSKAYVASRRIRLRQEDSQNASTVANRQILLSSLDSGRVLLDLEWRFQTRVHAYML